MKTTKVYDIETERMVDYPITDEAYNYYVEILVTRQRSASGLSFSVITPIFPVFHIRITENAYKGVYNTLKIP